MANPESVERRAYNGLVIEVELYRRCEGGFYAWPYIEKSHPNGTSKRCFVLDVESFATKAAQHCKPPRRGAKDDRPRQTWVEIAIHKG
jgi:hypothetical protein